MVKFTSVESTVLQEDKAGFNQQNQQLLWEEYVHTAEQLSSLARAARFLINTQNGTDIDDYVVGQGTRLVDVVCPEASGKDVLVLGTGTGREMKALREFGANRVEGVTLGKRNQKFANEVVGEYPVVCDLHMLPWGVEEFDMVAAFQVFEHTYAPVIFLLEVNRVLRTGGSLYMETPDSRTNSADSWLHHTICPTPRQMFALLMKAGFLPTKFVLDNNHYEAVGYKTERELPEEWADRADCHVYVEAVKQNPKTYQRGDLRRYHNMLSGQSFSW